MNNVIELICRLLPNRVLITVPTLQKDITYVVVGICGLDTKPMVIVKKNEEGARATFNVGCNLIESIIVNNFKNDEDKN